MDLPAENLDSIASNLGAYSIGFLYDNGCATRNMSGDLHDWPKRYQDHFYYLKMPSAQHKYLSLAQIAKNVDQVIVVAIGLSCWLSWLEATHQKAIAYRGHPLVHVRFDRPDITPEVWLGYININTTYYWSHLLSIVSSSQTISNVFQTFTMCLLLQDYVLKARHVARLTRNRKSGEIWPTLIDPAALHRGSISTSALAIISDSAAVSWLGLVFFRRWRADEGSNDRFLA